MRVFNEYREDVDTWAVLIAASLPFLGVGFALALQSTVAALVYLTTSVGIGLLLAGITARMAE